MLIVLIIVLILAREKDSIEDNDEDKLKQINSKEAKQPLPMKQNQYKAML
jgi:hypothetical protein